MNNGVGGMSLDNLTKYLYLGVWGYNNNRADCKDNSQVKNIEREAGCIVSTQIPAGNIQDSVE